jgi:5-methylcytosine-specific restriction endonuclease McrA
MKKIDILGKRNQDKMKQMADPDAVLEKKMPKKQMLDDERFYTDQNIGIAILKEFQDNDYKEIIVNKDVSASTIADATKAVATTAKKNENTLNILTLKHIVREIENKRKAYIYQDKQHSIYDPRYSISLEHIIALIIESNLNCYYCREICQLTYKEVMCRKQWTLDRIDNDYGHNHTNVVIACLDCNLKRGNMDSERFRQGKQFTFRKLE